MRNWVLIAAALGLFLVWSNSFIANGFLLGVDGGPVRLDWIGLTVARFLPASAICAIWCFGFRRAESMKLLRAYPGRLALCALLAVPGYNCALGYGQQHGVPAPVASLITTLVPLLVMILAAVFLGERPTARRIVGFAIAMVGMAVIASAKKGGGQAYPLVVAVTALAPLSWSIYSVMSKPVANRASPIIWTYLAIALGGAFVLPILPGPVWRQIRALDAPGWAALAYLAVPCTVLGFAVWTWLLRHLPASSVGFTVFLNPPLTTTSKFLLSALFPATFVFAIAGREWVGGAIVLCGLATAVWRRGRRLS
ncbi:MAG: DMT family transporter [bacterium]|nr:DMT family transporter [bacterium]